MLKKLIVILLLFLVSFSVNAGNSKTNFRIGAEFNFFRIFYLKEGVKSLSGTVSIFLPKKQIELAFPFYGATALNYSNERYSEGSIDFHFRKYIRGPFENFYLSSFVRSTYIKGRLDNSNIVDDENKYGLGVGFGIRKFSKSGLYWGASFSTGRYIIGENDKFKRCCFILSEESAVIADIELLKLGYMF